MMAGVMGAAFIRSHSLAFFAVECMVKKERRYTNLLRVKFVKYIMGIKCAVVIPYTCVVPSYNKMRAAIVFSYERMEYCLFWPCISHCRRIYNKGNPVFWVVVL